MPRGGGRPRLLWRLGLGPSGKSSTLFGMAAILASPVVVGPDNVVPPAALLGVARPASVHHEHSRLRRACQAKPAMTGWAGATDTLLVSQTAVSKALAIPA
eukprot:SM000002S05797  [mRNA]  locus=s2:2194147:2194859:+ [translate_table: standard]